MSEQAPLRRKNKDKQWLAGFDFALGLSGFIIAFASGVGFFKMLLEPPYDFSIHGFVGLVFGLACVGVHMRLVRILPRMPDYEDGKWHPRPIGRYGRLE